MKSGAGFPVIWDVEYFINLLSNLFLIFKTFSFILCMFMWAYGREHMCRPEESLQVLVFSFFYVVLSIGLMSWGSVASAFYLLSHLTGPLVPAFFIDIIEFTI